MEYYASYRTDLTKSEEKLFNGMDSACRRCVRKAEKSGVAIEEAHDPAFANEYYEQLKDVFSKQGLVPTYDLERLRLLVKHMVSLAGCAPAGSRSGREMHRIRNFPRLQPNRRILGQCQLSLQPGVAAQ